MRAGLLCALALAACGGGAAQLEMPSLSPRARPGARLGPEPAAPRSASGGVWLEAVHERFHSRWSDSFLEQIRIYLPATHALQDPGLETTIRFAVGADGAVHDVVTARSSGNGDFDAAAREVVAEHGPPAPLPPPPEELRSDDGDVHVTWRFARDVRQDGLAGAAVERKLWEPARAVPSLLAAGRIDEAADRVADALARAAPDARQALMPLARRVAAAVLLEALAGEKDPALRVAAVAALASAHWTDAAPALRRLGAEAPDIVLQAAALRALGDLHDDGSADMLLAAVERLDDERSAAAAGALVKLGKAADLWAQLAPDVTGPDGGRRGAAIADLVEAPVEPAAPSLLVALRDRTRPRAERAAAARALGGLAGAEDGPEARVLGASLADADAAVRAAALEALGRAAADRGLRSPRLARAALARLRDRDPRVKAAAAVAAAGLDGSAALAQLSAMATAGHPGAIAALGTMPGGAALPLLVKLSASKVSETRGAALEALARRDEPEARAVLVRLTDGDEVHLRALGTAATESEELLRDALADAAPEVRAAAVAPLVRIVGAERAFPAALHALEGFGGARGRVLIAGELLVATL